MEQPLMLPICYVCKREEARLKDLIKSVIARAALPPSNDKNKDDERSRLIGGRLSAGSISRDTSSPEPLLR